MSFNIFKFDDTLTFFWRFNFLIFIWDMKLWIISQFIIVFIIVNSNRKWRIIDMNKCLMIFSRFVWICTIKITSIDFKLFSNFYYFDHFDYFNHFKMIFYNRYCNNRVFHNFNKSFKIDSCRYRIYHHDFLCRVFYNFFVRDRRLDHYSESHFAMR
jgi:hypothetical protein